MSKLMDLEVDTALEKNEESLEEQIAGIEEALAALDRGEGLAHEEVVAELDSLLASYDV